MLLETPGLRIGYDDAGSGVPLVFLHAFPLNRAQWGPQIHGLSSHARCLAPDVRGFGESDVRGPCTMDRYADDVVAFLDALAIDTAVVAGLSLGGYIALALWWRHPERVRALILADTRATADSDADRARRAALIARVRAEGSAALAEDLLPVVLGPTSVSRDPALADGVARMIALAPVEGAVGALEAMRHRPDSSAMLGAISVPTLGLVGTEDAITPPSVMAGMCERIPDARLVRIRGAGHLSNLERPAAFNAAVSEFLRRCGSG